MSTGISWSDETWNPIVGCDKVSQGCKMCYAKTLHDMRHTAYLEGKLQNIPQYAQPFEAVQLMPDRLTKPLSWRKPRRIFVNSVSDLFHDDVPDEFIARVFVVMALAERHTFQVLTKRAKRMHDLMNDSRFVVEMVKQLRDLARSRNAVQAGEDAIAWPLPNVWLGVSVENQAAADERIPLLLKTPAALCFLSCEPLLGSVQIAEYLPNRLRNDIPSWKSPDIGWVIAGGETGSSQQSPRPMHPDWARSLRDQCVAAGVPFHFKQWGSWAPTRELALLPSDRRRCLRADGHEQWLPSFSEYAVLDRVSPATAGRELDGRVWDEFPAERVA